MMQVVYLLYISCSMTDLRLKSGAESFTYANVLFLHNYKPLPVDQKGVVRPGMETRHSTLRQFKAACEQLRNTSSQLLKSLRDVFDNWDKTNEDLYAIPYTEFLEMANSVINKLSSLKDQAPKAAKLLGGNVVSDLILVTSDLTEVLNDIIEFRLKFPQDKEAMDLMKELNSVR